MTTKNLLRKKALFKRNSLSKERKEQASFLACHFLKSLLEKEKSYIGCFASNSSEIDLWPLLSWLSLQNRLLLPKVEDDTLNFYKVMNLSHLKKSYLGIQEPNPSFCPLFPPEKIGIILVPGIAFDKEGNRLGYGKGYFDRFLAKTSDVIKWGIGFKENIIAKIPKEPHDVILDKVWSF